MGVLIVLLILFFPAAIVYYLLASEDIITIKNGNERSNTPSISAPIMLIMSMLVQTIVPLIHIVIIVVKEYIKVLNSVLFVEMT